jgi:hypothetical protein
MVYLDTRILAWGCNLMHILIMKMRAFGACLALAFWSGSSFAQAFNIDLGGPSELGPSNAYGGVPGQTGHWNKTYAGLPFTLRDLSGDTTTAQLYCQLAGKAIYDFVGGSPDELAMMNTAGLFGGLDNRLSVISLNPGVYDVYVYACGSPTFENLIITGGNSSTTVTIERGGWPGMQVEGRTYAKARLTLTPQANALTVICTNATLSPIAGLQIVPVPAPGAAMVGLASAGLVGLRRRR